MLVAVTGATGFVGRYVVERLLRRDHDLRLLVRDPRRAARLVERGGVELVTGRLDDAAALGALARGAGAVVHLVGIIVETGRQTFESVHVRGTRNLVDAAREAGVVRFVHMSALGARSDPAATAYHRTKAQAEDLVRSSGLSHAILRPSLVAAADSPVIRMMVDMVRLAPVVPVIGDGRYRMQPVAAEDVAEAFAVAIEKPDIEGSFDIAGAEAFTYHEILDRIEQALHVKRRRVRVPVPVARLAALAGRALPSLAPITPDQLTMLLEGNTTGDSALERVFGVRPRSFADVLREACEPYAPKVVAAG